MICNISIMLDTLPFSLNCNTIFVFMPFVYMLQLIVGTLMWKAMVVNYNLNVLDLNIPMHHGVSTV
jgi:hypothetical protein